jgi:hypothetical protein
LAGEDLLQRLPIFCEGAHIFGWLLLNHKKVFYLTIYITVEVLKMLSMMLESWDIIKKPVVTSS